MKKQNSATCIFDNSINGLLNMRRMAQFYPASASIDDFNNSNFEINSNYKPNNYDPECEYIPPSPSICIESDRKNNLNRFNNKNHVNNSRFSFLISDIQQDNDYSSNSDGTFKMKYELPNIETLHSPIKTFKPIQIVSFSKK